MKNYNYKVLYLFLFKAWPKCMRDSLKFILKMKTDLGVVLNYYFKSFIECPTKFGCNPD